MPAPLSVNKARAVILLLESVAVLLVKVCVSVVPTTSPVGTTLERSTADVPLPTKNLLAVKLLCPVPPLGTVNTLTTSN